MNLTRIRFTSEQMLVLLRTHGHRLTTSRETITDAIESLVDGFSAADVLQAVQGHDAAVGRATIFRTLDLLVQYGALDIIHAPDGTHRYTRAIVTDVHYHLLTCSMCGTVVPFEGCALEELLEDLGRKTNFQIAGHMLEVFGLCSTCMDRSRPDPPSVPSQHGLPCTPNTPIDIIN